MVQASSQRILVGFKNEKSLQQAVQHLQKENLSTVKSSAVPPVNDTVPKARSLGSGGLKSAGIGGIIGAIMGALIMTTALNIPNQGTIYNNAVPLSVLAVLAGAVFGAGASGLFAFFAGSNREQASKANYQLIIEASSEEIKTVTNIMLGNGGRLL